MTVLDDRRYTDQHEWVLDAGDGKVRMGITDYAQDALGDIVYVELPASGSEVKRGQPVAEVESTKSVADVYAPVSGTVDAANELLATQPEIINSDPYGEGWFLDIEASDTADLDGLLTPDDYRALID